MIDTKKLIEMYNEGYSQSEIASYFNVAHTSIKYWLKKLNISIKKRNLLKNEIEQIPILYNQGYSLVEISKKFSVSPEAIGQWAKKLNLKILPNGRFKELNLNTNLIQELYCENLLSTTEIAQKLNCSRQAIEKRLSQLDIPIRGSIKPIEKTQSDRIVSLYKNEKTIKNIVKELNLTESIIRRQLRIKNVITRKAHAKFKISINSLTEIKDLYLLGTTLEELSLLYKVSLSCMSSFLKRNKISLRPPGKTKIFSKFNNRNIKFDSSWEKYLYEILLSSYGDEVLFQGDYTNPKCNNLIINLIKPISIQQIYPTKNTFYKWHPDFIIPSVNLIIETKGNYWATKHWNNIIVPSIKHNKDKLKYSIVALYKSPIGLSLKEIEKLFIKII